MGVEAWPWEVWVNGNEPRVPETVTRTPGPKSLRQETGCQTRQTPSPGLRSGPRGAAGGGVAGGCEQKRGAIWGVGPAHHRARVCDQRCPMCSERQAPTGPPPRG